MADLSFYLGLTRKLPKLNEKFLTTISDDLIKLMYEQAVRCEVSADVKVVIDSDVIAGILQDQKELQSDLIVTGGLGGHARKICSPSPVPVLVVKNDQMNAKVAALVDTSQEIKEIIQVSRALAEGERAELSVISLLQQLPGLYEGNIFKYSSVVINSLRNAAELQLVKNKEEIDQALNGTHAKVIAASTFEKILDFI